MKLGPYDDVTSKIKHKVSEGSKNLLVDKGRSIGPQEEDSQKKDHYMAEQSYQMIFKTLKKNPQYSGCTKNTCRFFLVPP